METSKTELGDFVDDLKDYIQTSAEVYKLQAIEKVAVAGSGIFINLILLIVTSMAFLFVSIAAAYLIGEWLGQTYLGFLVVAGFYVLVGMVIQFTRDKGLKDTITDSIIRSIFKS